jgi:alcohol dehydrogenase
MDSSAVPAEYTAFRVAFENDRVTRSVTTLRSDSLPDGDVTVRVEYSALNYKDALSATGNRGVTRTYPHTPGIDAAGTVLTSTDPRFAAGASVICTGYELGMSVAGGFGQLIRVPGDWLVPIPNGLTTRSAMVLGTAGITAALSVDRLRSVSAGPDLGPFVVTGASGGVGSVATALLHRAGYTVLASTGKERAHAFLMRLGAAKVIAREELSRPSDKQLQRAVYGGGIDSVGGRTLVNLINSTVPGGAVAACGLVSGVDLPANIFPFILRGVALLGVDSQHVQHADRLRLWGELSHAWLAGTFEPLAAAVTEVGLHELDDKVDEILAGAVMGRVVVRID